MNFSKLLIALFPCTLVLTQAHPGHGMLEHGAAHVATSPYHLFVLVATALVLFVVGQVVRNSTARRILRVAGTTALLAGAAVWGMGL